MLAGARRLLTEHAPVVSMEVHAAQEDGGLSERAVAALRALGYRAHNLGHDGDAEPIAGDLAHAIDPTSGFSNFIFMK